MVLVLEIPLLHGNILLKFIFCSEGSEVHTEPTRAAEPSEPKAEEKKKVCSAVQDSAEIEILSGKRMAKSNTDLFRFDSLQTETKKKKKTRSVFSETDDTHSAR